MNGEFTLAELARLTATEPRTIRSYIAEGLMRGSDAVGRNAHYGRHHFDRLRAIRVLRDQERLGLAEIRRRFLTLTDEAIASIAARLHGGEPTAGAKADAASALEYIRALRTRLKAEEVARPLGLTSAEHAGEVLSLREDQLSWSRSSERDSAAPDAGRHFLPARLPANREARAMMAVSASRDLALSGTASPSTSGGVREQLAQIHHVLRDLRAEVIAARERDKQLSDALARTQSELERLRRACEAAVPPIFAPDQAGPAPDGRDPPVFIRISVLPGIEIIVSGAPDPDQLRLIHQHSESLKKALQKDTNDDC